MKLEILETIENKPLARKEVKFRVDHQGGTTPSRLTVRDKIVAQYDAEASAVVVRWLRTKFGVGISEGSARIYSSPEMMQKVEMSHVIKRHGSKKKSEEE